MRHTAFRLHPRCYTHRSFRAPVHRMLLSAHAEHSPLAGCPILSHQLHRLFSLLSSLPLLPFNNRSLPPLLPQRSQPLFHLPQLFLNPHSVLSGHLITQISSALHPSPVEQRSFRSTSISHPTHTRHSRTSSLDKSPSLSLSLRPYQQWPLSPTQLL